MSATVDIQIPSCVEYNGVKIHYVKKDEMGGSPYTFFPRPDGDGYNLLMMSEQIPKTGTIIMYLKGEIYSTANLAKILSVINPATNFTNGLFPPKTITSIRMNSPNPGEPPIRRGREDGGIFQNSTIMDIWHSDGKKYCSTKFSDSKLAMFGVNNYDTAAEIGKIFLSHVKDALRFHHLLKEHPKEFQDAVDWLIERSKGEVIEKFAMDSDSGDIMTDYDYVLKWTWDGVPVKTDYSGQLTNYFIDEIRRRFMLDTNYITTISGLRKHMIEIFHMPDIASSDIGVLGFQRTMINYNYVFPFKINRIEMNGYLNMFLADSDYTINFHNSSRTDLKVTTFSPITADSNEIFRRDGEKVKQTFFFYKDGKVMHSGPGGKSSEDRYYDFTIKLILIHAYINSVKRD